MTLAPLKVRLVEASIDPVMVAEVAVSAPACVTLNGADAKAALPRYMPLLSALNILFPVPIAIVPEKSPSTPDSVPLTVSVPSI